MSRSTPTLENPVERRFKFKGKTGVVVYYDKIEAKEIEVEYPFRFMVLDQLSAITGYSKKQKLGFWSNEVRSVVKEELIVRSKNGVEAAGFYKDLKTERNFKYARSVYIAYEDKGKWHLGNIQLTGSSMSAWFDFCKTTRVENGAVVITGAVLDDSGEIPFHTPTYVYESCTEDENSTAVELDKCLQDYFKSREAAYKVVHEEPVDDAPPLTDEDAPIDLNDIPF